MIKLQVLHSFGHSCCPSPSQITFSTAGNFENGCALGLPVGPAPSGREMSYNDSCGVCRICMTVAAWLYGRGFLPSLHATIIHIVIKEIPLCAIHRHVPGHHRITSDWSKHTGKHSLGTQKLLLDIALSHSCNFDFVYPTYIVGEFSELLGNVFEGQTDKCFDEAVQ